MVEKQTIERIRTHVANCSDETLEQEFDQFFARQSEVCNFVMDVTSSSSQRVRELSLYLSYVTYKALSEDTGLTTPVGAEVIVNASRESQEWIQRVSEMNADQFSSATASEVGNEPYLLGFVIGEVQDAVEDGLDLGEEEKGTIFFVLKTVIASMTLNVNDA
jgi:hypothetical protein